MNPSIRPREVAALPLESRRITATTHEMLTLLRQDPLIQLLRTQHPEVYQQACQTLLQSQAPLKREHILHRLRMVSLNHTLPIQTDQLDFQFKDTRQTCANLNLFYGISFLETDFKRLLKNWGEIYREAWSTLPITELSQTLLHHPQLRSLKRENLDQYSSVLSNFILDSLYLAQSIQRRPELLSYVTNKEVEAAYTKSIQNLLSLEPTNNHADNLPSPMQQLVAQYEAKYAEDRAKADKNMTQLYEGIIQKAREIVQAQVKTFGSPAEESYAVALFTRIQEVFATQDKGLIKAFDQTLHRVSVILHALKRYQPSPNRFMPESKPNLNLPQQLQEIYSQALDYVESSPQELSKKEIGDLVKRLCRRIQPFGSRSDSAASFSPD